MKNQRPLLVFICLFLGNLTLNGQELLVPIDGEGKVLRIDHETASRLQLFQDVRGLVDVYLLQLHDSSYVLEVWYKLEGKTLKKRQPMSVEEAVSLRESVTRAIVQRDPSAGVNQEGRSKFLGSINALALGYYGWAIPAVLEMEGAAAVGVYTLIGAGSFFIPYSATERSEISDEAATLFMYGSTGGILHGIAVGYLIFDDDAKFRGNLVAGMIGGIVEGSLAFSLAKSQKLTSGSVEVIGTLADAGMGYGFGAAYVGEFTNNRRGVAASVLIGSAVGIVTGSVMTSRESYSSGDANVLRATALLCGYLPVAALGIAETGNGRDVALAAMIGGALGIGLGHSFVSGKDFSTSQGAYIGLSTLGGGLIGLGIAAITNADSKVYLALSSVGAAAGFSTMYSAYSPLARASAETAGLELSIHPESIALNRLKKNQSPTVVAPFISFRYSF
jgi:hypothetical protein